MLDLKNVKRGRIERVRREVQGRQVHPDRRQGRPQPAVGPSRPTCAFPSAIQNEINAKDAANLLKNGVYVVSEGANMPTIPEGVDLFVEKPASSTAPARPPTPAAWPPPASRCRRTACAWPGPREEVDARLHGIMKAIHKQCVDAANALRHPRQLRERRQHRRLRQGRRLHARPGHRLIRRSRLRKRDGRAVALAQANAVEAAGRAPRGARPAAFSLVRALPRSWPARGQARHACRFRHPVAPRVSHSAKLRGARV